MDLIRLDRLNILLGKRLLGVSGRRALLQGAASLGAIAMGRSAGPVAAAPAKPQCNQGGVLCPNSPKKQKNGKCKASNCLGTSLTVEAKWTKAGKDHDTFLFVPNEAGASLPAPFVNNSCNASSTNCENDVYPFTCVSQDAFGPGDEITAVRKLVNGKYEYWIALYYSSLAGDVTVTLRRANGSVVRSWSSPPNPNTGAPDRIGWHVFDIQGKSRSITSINKVVNNTPPNATLPFVHQPYTYVCPRFGYP